MLSYPEGQPVTPHVTNQLLGTTKLYVLRFAFHASSFAFGGSMIQSKSLAILSLSAFLLAACIAGPIALNDITPIAATPAVVTPLATVPSNDETAVPLVTASVTASPTAAPGQPGAPSWWPADLPLPASALLTTGTGTPAVWTCPDLNVAKMKDSLTLEATHAGYTIYTITQSQGSIYDLLFVKGAAAYALNLTEGTDTTILTGNQVGTLHLRVSGYVNLDLNLPLRDRLDTSPGSEVSLGTSVPNTACDGCQYYINVHIAPFNGIGTYASQPPGTYIIDVELIPGGTDVKDDYRWAKSCTVRVQDAQTGSFDCRGLENINDNTKVLDASGEWKQPP